MNIIGVDVSKETLIGVRIDRSSQVKESYTVTNTPEEVGVFVQGVKAKFPKIVLACEATGEHHLVLIKACLSFEVPIKVLNPILTKQFTRGTVRKKKTDLTDAEIIAKLALQGQGWEVRGYDNDLVKPTLRVSTKLAAINERLGLMRARLVRLGLDESLIQEIATCQKSLTTAAASYKKGASLKQNQAELALLTSIPGIGKTLASCILAEIDSVSRFRNGSALVAFTGLDPKVKQSGQSLNHNTHLTKRGSPHLRRALYIAAYIAARHDPELKEYFVRKRNEGKFYKEAVVAVARKLTYRIYAVLLRKSPYVVKGAT